MPKGFQKSDSFWVYPRFVNSLLNDDKLLCVRLTLPVQHRPTLPFSQQSAACPAPGAPPWP